MSEQVCIDESGGGCLFCSWQPGKREKNKEKPGFQYPLQRHVPSGYNTCMEMAQGNTLCHYLSFTKSENRRTEQVLQGEGRELGKGMEG
jgi:hypothetical protein